MLGQRYRLRVVEEGSAARLSPRGKVSMLLNVRVDTGKRQELLQALFTRAELSRLDGSQFLA